MMVWLRTLLVWTLVLTVPAQGFAAATRIFCGQNGAAATAAVSGPEQGTDRSRMVDAAARSVLCEHHHSVLSDSHTGAQAGTPMEAAQEPVAADEEQHHSTSKASKASHGCSACAACCAPGVLPSTALTVPAIDPVVTVFVAVVPAIAVFANLGPDRPPRLSRA